MTPFTITLDDDPHVYPLIKAATGWETLAFSTVQGLHDWNFTEPPAVAFVDVHLDVDQCGLDMIPFIRSSFPLCPIIVITGDKGDDAIGQALATGANDFVRKPLNKAELAARVRARMIEMSYFAANDTLEIGDIKLYRRYRIVERGSIKRSLSVTQMMLLETLYLAKGVVSREDIKRKVWGKTVVTENALDRKLFELRGILKDFGESVRVKASYGVGICLEVQEAFGAQKEGP